MGHANTVKKRKVGEGGIHIYSTAINFQTEMVLLCFFLDGVRRWRETGRGQITCVATINLIYWKTEQPIFIYYCDGQFPFSYSLNSILTMCSICFLH